jgi:penicillin-binding protein 2
VRLKVILITISSFIFLVACHLFYLQILKGSAYYSLSINNSIRVVPVEAPRGRILDRNGVVLADNRHSFDVTIVPQELDDKDEVFDFLAQTLQIDKKKMLQQFWQRKVAPFSPVVVVEDVTKAQAMSVEENRYRFPGLYIEESYNRYYPFHEVGAHVLGYVGKMNREELEQLNDYGHSPLSTVGKNGIEDFYDSYLRGHEGGLQMEINSRGRQVRLLGIRQPQSGQDITLTVDQRVQQMAYDSLASRRGAVIVMSLETGEILTMVSSPAFDPNIFVDSQLRLKTGALFVDPQAPLLNRAIKGQYPPGSVFKIVVAAAGLATNRLDPARTYNCDGVYELGAAKFRCMHIHGPQNLFQGIMHSCNIYFYNVSQAIGAESIYRYARLLGLGRLTGIDIPFEEKGNLSGPSLRKWYTGDTLNMSIGQGDVLTTPMQLLRVLATVGLNGREVQPYFLKAINHQELVKLSTSRQVGMIPQVYEILNNALRMVVDESGGTAHILDIPNMKVAGKTGTAQSGRGRDSHAWFVGYTLDTQPRVAICVFLEYGGSSHNSVVVAQDILKQMRLADII